MYKIQWQASNSSQSYTCKQLQWSDQFTSWYAARLKNTQHWQTYTILIRLRPIPVLGIGIGPIPVVSVWYRYRRYCSRYQTDTGRPWHLCNDSKCCLLTIH